MKKSNKWVISWTWKTKLSPLYSVTSLDELIQGSGGDTFQCTYERIVSPLHNEPVTFPAYAGTHLYTWVERSKLEWSALLKDTTRGPHRVQTHNPGIMSPELYCWTTRASIYRELKKKKKERRH